MAKILIVDDDTTFCIMLRKWLEKRGFDVDTAFSYKDAVKQLDKAGFDLVLTDLRLPDKDGIDLLRVIKEKTPETQVLLMTGYADIQTAVTAIKLGAFDYVAKPVIPDEILKKLQEALKLEAGPVAKSIPAKAKTTSFSYIKGVSEGADRQYEYIHLVGPTTMTVLINGESGTGKEYIARLIHSMSNRKDGPFVAVDCGAIPKDLGASEFFGHIKGSFTGAVTDKQGYFVTASGVQFSWMRLVICLMTCKFSCCAHSKSERCIRWVGMLIFLLMFVLFQPRMRISKRPSQVVLSGRICIFV